jgi:hypothetical protein
MAITPIDVAFTDHARIASEPEVGQKRGAGKFGSSAFHKYVHAGLAGIAAVLLIQIMTK